MPKHSRMTSHIVELNCFFLTQKRKKAQRISSYFNVERPIWAQTNHITEYSNGIGSTRKSCDITRWIVLYLCIVYICWQAKYRKKNGIRKWVWGKTFVVIPSFIYVSVLIFRSELCRMVFNSYHSIAHISINAVIKIISIIIFIEQFMYSLIPYVCVYRSLSFNCDRCWLAIAM